MAKKWIQKARSSMEKRGTVGSFTKAAKRAGMTVSQYTSHVLKKGSKASAKMKKKAGFAKAMRSIHRKKKGHGGKIKWVKQKK